MGLGRRRDCPLAVEFEHRAVRPACIPGTGPGPRHPHRLRVAVGGQDIAADDAGNQTGRSPEPCWPTPAATMPSRTRGTSPTIRRVREGRRGEDRGRLRHRLVPVICLGEPTRLDTGAAVEESVRQLRHAGRRSARHAGRPGRGRVRAALGDRRRRTRPEEHIHAVVAGLRGAVSDWNRVVRHLRRQRRPGLLTRLADGVDGLFLGRFAHDPQAFATVLDEAIALQLKTVAS